MTTSSGPRRPINLPLGSLASAAAPLAVHVFFDEHGQCFRAQREDGGGLGSLPSPVHQSAQSPWISASPPVHSICPLPTPASPRTGLFRLCHVCSVARLCGTRPGPAVADSYGGGPDRSYLHIWPFLSARSLLIPHPHTRFHCLPSTNSVRARPPGSLLTCASIQPTRPHLLREYDKHQQSARSGDHRASHARTTGLSLPSTRSQTATQPGSVHVSHYYGTAELAPSR